MSKTNCVYARVSRHICYAKMNVTTHRGRVDTSKLGRLHIGNARVDIDSKLWKRDVETAHGT